MFGEDVPSPDFSNELDLLQSRAQPHPDAGTSHMTPGAQNIKHQLDTPSSSCDDSNSGTDFEFMNSLLSIRGTRDQDSDPVGLGADGPSESEAAVAETIVRARKSWKTVKGRSEPVWPPHLEKALVQGELCARWLHQN